MGELRKRRQPREWPIRKCRSLHSCELCSQDIRLGQEYYDGGYFRRRHVNCQENLPEHYRK